MTARECDAVRDRCLGQGTGIMWPGAETMHLRTAGWSSAEMAITPVAGNEQRPRVRAACALVQSAGGTHTQFKGDCIETEKICPRARGAHGLLGMTIK